MLPHKIYWVTGVPIFITLVLIETACLLVLLKFDCNSINTFGIIFDNEYLLEHLFDFLRFNILPLN